MKHTPLDIFRMLLLSARLLAGRRFWVFPLLPLAWVLYLIARLLLGWRTARYEPDEVQFFIAGLPLAVLAMVLGVRIVAAEVEQRTLETTYTVPGGARRVLLWKTAAAVVILAVAELLLLIVAHVFLTPVPLVTIYGVLQGAVFYLVLAVALGALVRSELSALLACLPVLVMTAGAFGTSRFSPLFNPLLHAGSPEVYVWMLQNYVGYALLIALVAALAFARAERREKLLD